MILHFHYLSSRYNDEKRINAVKRLLRDMKFVYPSYVLKSNITGHDPGFKRLILLLNFVVHWTTLVGGTICLVVE